MAANNDDLTADVNRLYTRAYAAVMHGVCADVNYGDVTRDEALDIAADYFRAAGTRAFDDGPADGVPYPPPQLDVRGYEDLIKTACDDAPTEDRPVNAEWYRFTLERAERAEAKLAEVREWCNGWLEERYPATANDLRRIVDGGASALCRPSTTTCYAAPSVSRGTCPRVRSSEPWCGRRGGRWTVADLTKDEGHTVALPLTQEQAREKLKLAIAPRYYRGQGVEAIMDEFLSAPHEVLAAAMGGRAWTEYRHPGNVWLDEPYEGSDQKRTVIVLPLREVDGEAVDV